MNSITFLDSVLTRSLSSSRRASGSNTPVDEDDGGALSRRRRTSANGGEGNRLGRRASDYSLHREREREKRKVAASLGLTALHTANGNEREERRVQRKASRQSSRRSSARASSAEDDDGANVRRSRAERKSSSEAAEQHAAERTRTRRTETLPANQWQAAPRSWSSLWGFGGFLEEARAGRPANQQGLRPDSSGQHRARLSRSSTDLSPASLPFPHRRASTGGADAAGMQQIAHHALLSEREREDVVDFEGADPEDELTTFPNTPPSTPWPREGSKTPSPEHSRRTSMASDNFPSVLGTGSRLSSILFGALNPLTDDYFGPQPSKRKASIGNAARPKRSSVLEDKHESGHSTASEASTGDSHATPKTEEELLSDSARVSLELSPVPEEKRDSSKEVQKQLKSHDAKLPEPAEAHRATDAFPKDPPPPYSDAANGIIPSSLLPLPSQAIGTSSDGIADRKGVRRGRLASALVRGAKTTIELLQRVFLIILLGPYRAYQSIKRAFSGKQRRLMEIPATSKAADGDQDRNDAKRPQSSTSAKQAGTKRIQASRVASLTSKGRVSDSESEEPVTEEQAASKAQRRQHRNEMSAKDGSVEKDAGRTIPGSALVSRLLPNPHPIDPLLSHVPDAEKRNLQEKAQHEEQQRQLQLARRSKQAQASGRAAVINRGPSSMLIHHSPKVLVLDLDETLIHSTSRSPTWGALADKSKSRTAVTAGGSLLGLEGLGGVLGLRGQVGVRPHQVEVVLDGRSLIYHVYKRPHVDTFLRKVAAWYHVVVFTASVQEYADPVIDWLDQGRGLISGRLFREACTYRNGSYFKNLAHVDADLSRVCLVDNSPASYAINQANGIPIEGWTHDPHDEALLDLLPILDSLRFASDVRHILGVRGFSA